MPQSMVVIRALRPDDRADMLTAIGRASAQSLQRRFFVPKKGFSEREITFFLNVDFETHVALIAQIEEDGQPHRGRLPLYHRPAAPG